MLHRVAWANEKLADLGLQDEFCIVYAFRAARLWSANGKELLVVEQVDEDGIDHPELAIWLLTTTMLSKLRQFLAHPAGCARHTKGKS